MSQNVSPAIMALFRARMKANGVEPNIDFPGVSVGVPHAETVPFTGNIHIGRKRVAKREVVDLRFSKLNF